MTGGAAIGTGTKVSKAEKEEASALSSNLSDHRLLDVVEGPLTKNERCVFSAVARFCWCRREGGRSSCPSADLEAQRDAAKKGSKSGEKETRGMEMGYLESK